MADPRKYQVPRRVMPGQMAIMDASQRAIDRHIQMTSAAQEFGAHVHFYFSDDTMVKSGDRGLRFDKTDKTDPNPVAIDYLVQGVPFWGTGMDGSTNTTDGSSDMVYAFDYTALAGAGQDIFRISNESNASGASASKTPKFMVGRSAGSTTRSQTVFFLISGGDNSNGIGGLEVRYWDAGGGYDALLLTQRNAAKKRACVNFNGAWAMGNDEANVNTNIFWLTDKTGGGAGACLRVDPGTGQFYVLHDFLHAGSKLGFYNVTTVTQPAGSSDVLASLVSLGLRAASSNPPLDLGTGALTCGRVKSSGAAPTVTAGAQAGTSPPAPVLASNSTDQRGQITFGTGTGATAGAMVHIVYANAYAADPVVILQQYDDTLPTQGVTVANHSATGFDIYLHSAPTSGQPNTTYKVNYWVIW